MQSAGHLPQGTARLGKGHWVNDRVTQGLLSAGVLVAGCSDLLMRNPQLSAALLCSGWFPEPLSVCLIDLFSWHFVLGFP